MIGMPSRIGKASLAAREISSCFSASYSSGVLVNGQTRISRSFGSTLSAGRSDEGEDMLSSALTDSISIISVIACEADGLLQRCFARRLALGKLDLGDGDQNLGAGFQIRRLQHGLFLGGVVRRHHRQRVHQSFVGRVLDALPIRLEVVGLEER